MRTQYFGIGLLLILVICCGSVTSSLAAQSTDDSSRKIVLCQLFSVDKMSYCTGVSSWLPHRGGSYSAIMPLKLRTGESRCRISIGSSAFFEAAPLSELELKSSASGAYELSIKRGSVVYALAEGIELKVTEPLANIVAATAATAATTVAEQPAVITASSQMGIVTVTADDEGAPQIEVTNLRGKINVTGSNNQKQDLTEGKALRFTKSGQSGWSASPFSITALLEATSTESNETATRTAATVNPVLNSLNNNFLQQVVISDPELQAWDMIKAPKSSNSGSQSVNGFSLSFRSTEAELSSLDRWEGDTLVYSLATNRPDKSPPHPSWVWCERHNRWHPKAHN